MFSRNGQGLIGRTIRRVAVITGAAATSLAILATPAQAASAPGTCFSSTDNAGQTGVNITFPTVQLASGTSIKLTVAAQTGGQPQAHAIYFWDGTTPYWQEQLPQEIFGGEWRPSPKRVNAPGEVAAFIPGYRASVNAWFIKEYIQGGVVTGVENNVPVRMADGGPCHT